MVNKKKIKTGIGYLQKSGCFLIQQNCIKTGETRVKDKPYSKKLCNTIVHSKKKKGEKNKNDSITLQSAPES